MPFSPLEVLLELTSLASIIGSILLLSIDWLALPEILPGRFNLFNDSRGLGEKINLIFYPLWQLVLYILFTLLSKYPQNYNYPWPITANNVSRQYRLARTLIRWLKTAIILFLALLEWNTICLALQKTTLSWQIIGLIFVPIVFVVLGTYIFLAWQAR